MNMTLLEIIYNWLYACAMGVGTALVVIGIPAVVGTLMEKRKKEKEYFNIIIERLKGESGSERVRVYTQNLHSHLPEEEMPELKTKLVQLSNEKFIKIIEMKYFHPILKLIQSLSFGFFGIDRILYGSLRNTIIGVIKILGTLSTAGIIFILNYNKSAFLNSFIENISKNLKPFAPIVIAYFAIVAVVGIAILVGFFFIVFDCIKSVKLAKRRNLELINAIIDSED
ncbi:MAG: hypothetical protein WCQ41_03615 [Bacillota bacterium]